ncbi:CgeB family protein [Mannheimia haemolytica]|uniref:CgeB family protein n=1 Tax=Mannheimia haemolytica TaxID=75985 RepID=UPI000697DAAA|nr:glycosyltransferase [Mannheimia haemolytica]UQX69901.1 glycosyltransferase [Mannheimia haemolytica]
MNKSDLDNLKSRFHQENIQLSERQFEKTVKLFKEFSNNIQEGQQKEINQLQEELYHLRVEKSKYQLLLSQRFQDKNNQTIAYQFGRLVLDFFKNPIRNFITPNALLSIYIQYLNRKARKNQLTFFQKKCVEWFDHLDTKKSIDDTFDTLVQAPALWEQNDVKTKSVINAPTKKRKALKRNFSHKKAKELKVAIILDEFSFNSFKDEFTPLIITPSNWKMVFAQHKPDLFFCESAWSGTDSINRPWKGKVYASVNFIKENRNELLEILDYCNTHGIPTIFWNKEDPTHYPDRVHDFVKTACLFDFVFTTAQECIEKYKQEYGLENVYALPFATNPAIFNPIDNPEIPRTEKIVFAGSWYANHIERSKTMHKLFDSLIGNGYELEFYNRYHNDDDPNHLIPEQYRKYEKPSVPNKETSRIYKSSLFGLNLNTVVDSETMFARRVFELMSSNTLVLSNCSKGMEKMFGNNVLFLDKDPSRLKALTHQEIERIREDNLNNVLANHTYQKRFESILNTIGIIYDKEQEKITLTIKILNKKQLQEEIRLFQQKFRDDKYRLLAVLTDSISDLDAAELYSELNYQKINILAESYVKRYGNERSKYLETPYFVLTDSLKYLEHTIIEKALLHSSYISDNYIALSAHKKQKYIFEPKMEMNHIFAPAQKFTEAITYFKKTVDYPIYYINKLEAA